MENIRGLAGCGCYGFNFHDDDLVPFGSSAAETDRILAKTRELMRKEGIANAMVTCNMFEQPVFKDGALTSNDGRVRAYARQKAMRAIDMGAELGASVYVMWGGREGLEVEASKNPIEAIKRYREGVEFLGHYIKDNGYGMVIAIEPKPNEPRGDIYFPTVGHMLHFISTLDHPDMVGVNPEFAHETMAGLNFVHAVAQALEAGKLFHIDLNDQVMGRYDQDFRFASENPKRAFFLVKLLEEGRSKAQSYDGPRHFDAHAFRQ